MDERACNHCGATLTGRKEQYCDKRCMAAAAWQRRKARDPGVGKGALTCASCGERLYRGTGSLPQGQAMCRPCRASRPWSPKSNPSTRRNACADCGTPSYGERCRSCNDAQLARGSRTPEQVRIQRRALQARRALRLNAAPGLNTQGRRDLLAQWQRQGRRCAYCPGPAETVDHVVPLALGGTNYEGNLVPACRRCNSRKNDSLLIEWRVKQTVLAA